MPRKSVVTDRKKEELLDALRKAMPLSFACDLIGIPRTTVYDYMNKDDAFRTKIDVAKAEAIRGLVALTGKQGGAWKLLKNVGKEEFKEHVEVEAKSTHTLFLETGQDDETGEIEREAYLLP